jgi:hypothetical protein
MKVCQYYCQDVSNSVAEIGVSTINIWHSPCTKAFICI